jgi:hypothetical protein
MAKAFDSFIFETAEAAQASDHIGQGRNKVYRVTGPGGRKAIYVVAVSPTEAVGRGAARLGITAEHIEAPAPSPFQVFMGQLDSMSEDERAALRRALK